MANRLMAIDPGNTGGWAIFEGDKLIDAGTYKLLLHVKAIKEKYNPLALVIEIPQVYKQQHWKGDPNDLIKVAIGVGTVRALFELHGLPVVEIKPRDWKGSVPKKIHNKRVLATIDKKECDGSWRKDHNAIDAVGIGLHAVRRALCSQTTTLTKD